MSIEMVNVSRILKYRNPEVIVMKGNREYYGVLTVEPSGIMKGKECGWMTDSTLARAKEYWLFVRF